MCCEIEYIPSVTDMKLQLKNLCFGEDALGKFDFDAGSLTSL